MVDLTPVMNAIITILAALAVRYLVPWISEHTTAKKREDLLVWVDIAVRAAQQMFYQASGSERLEYVLDYLEAKGFDVDDQSVRNAIEAAVLELHQSLEG